MIKETLKLGFVCAIICLAPTPAFAVRIGDFPGMEALIEKADAIVILRVDHHVDIQSNPTLYTTHDCFIYRTLKGELPSGKTTRLRLMAPNQPFVTPFAMRSTHLVFLTRKRSPSESTDFRTIEFKGASIQLPPFAGEVFPEGKTAAQQITYLLERTIKHNESEHEKELAFLKRAIE